MRRAIGIGVAGAVVGVLTKWVDDVGPRLDPVAGAVLGGLGSAPALWVLVVVVIARVGLPTPPEAAVRAGVFFVGLCAGYYAYSELALGISGMGLTVFWLAIAATVAPVAAGLAAWTGRWSNASVGSSRRHLAWAAAGAFAAVPLVHLWGYALAATTTDGAEAIASWILSAAQVPIAAGIWLGLATTAAARGATLIWGIVFAPAAWLGLDILLRALTWLIGVGRD